MADLDSFFAKKDKKKLKGKKFTTTEEIARRLEDTERKVEKDFQSDVNEVNIKKNALPIDKNEHNQKVVPTVASETHVQKTEEQWNDFKEEQEIDVTNLKITNLNIQEEEDGSDSNDEDGSTNGDGSKKEVWKVEKAPEMSVCDVIDEMDCMRDVKATVAAMSANVNWKSSMGPDMQASPLPRALGSRRKNAAPDLNNSEAFPTLGAKPNKKKGGKSKGEKTPSAEAKYPNSAFSGGRSFSAASRPSPAGGNAKVYVPPNLRTNNRFGGLSDQSSRY